MEDARLTSQVIDTSIWDLRLLLGLWLAPATRHRPLVLRWWLLPLLLGLLLWHVLHAPATLVSDLLLGLRLSLWLGLWLCLRLCLGRCLPSWLCRSLVLVDLLKG